MKIAGKAYRTIWLDDDGCSVNVIDQTRLPHALEFRTLRTLEDAIDAIGSMVVRGAPLVGAAAAYGLALAVSRDPSDAGIASACERLSKTRPTAVNLRWALQRLSLGLIASPPMSRRTLAYRLAGDLCDEDVRMNRAIGLAGAKVIADVWHRSGRKKAGQHTDSLQRRLARHGGLGHRAGANLSGL